MLHSGIDYFTSDIGKGKKTDIRCLACGENLKGEMAKGALSYAAALSGSTKEHWSYTCPHSELEDHVPLVALLKEMGNFVSEKLKAIVQEEYDEKRAAFMRKHFTPR